MNVSGGNNFAIEGAVTLHGHNTVATVSVLYPSLVRREGGFSSPFAKILGMKLL